MSDYFIKLKARSAGLGFLLPSLLGISIFFIWPFASTIKYALYDKPIGGSFAGLNNFVELMGNPAYRLGLKNTLIFMAFSIPLNMALALSSALVLKNSAHRKLFTLIFLVPMVIPSGSTAFFWQKMFAKNGFLNGLLYSIGLSRINWLDSEYAMAVIVIIFAWKNIGYNMILFLSGLASIPKEHYESAHVDGASRLRVFLHITMPGLAPTFVIIFIMNVINSFKVFKEVYLLTGSHPNESIYLLQHFMNNMFNSLNYPRLGAASILVAAVAGIAAIIFVKMERQV